MSTPNSHSTCFVSGHFMVACCLMSATSKVANRNRTTTQAHHQNLPMLLFQVQRCPRSKYICWSTAQPQGSCWAARQNGGVAMKSVSCQRPRRFRPPTTRRSSSFPRHPITQEKPRQVNNHKSYVFCFPYSFVTFRRFRQILHL